jgi:undecaprenyl-diphosphatase
MTDIWIAVVLGIVLGLTEYLPISSAGHLIVVSAALHFTGPKATCFQVFIQIGAISAVVVLYRHRFLRLLPGGSPSADGTQAFGGMKGIILLVLTTIPAVILGAAFHHAIKTHLFTPLIVAGALAVGGLGIFAAERYRPKPTILNLDDVGYSQAIKIGLFQCLALCPGVSRSGSTIVGGFLCGMDRGVAAEYSFLAAVPILSAAALFDLYKNWHLFAMSDMWFFIVGLIVSFISACFAVKTFISLLQRWTLIPFGVYRILIAPIIYLFMR